MRGWMAAAALASAVPLFAQQPAQIQILADRVRLIAGETQPLTAVVRDTGGALVRGAPVVWSLTYGAGNVATIDPTGRLTARSLGVVVVRAEIPNGPRVETAFQVLPLRVTIDPTEVEIPIGSTRQFTATAFDKDNRPLPGVVFQWRPVAVNFEAAPPLGNLEVAPTGLVRARYEGVAYVRATFAYSVPTSGLPLNMQATVQAQALVRVTGPRDYTVRIAHAPRKSPSGELRYRPAVIFAAPDGGIYFNGTLGSLSNGMLRWKDGVLEPVLLAGRASNAPGSTVLDFGSQAMGPSGDLLVHEVTTDGARIVRRGVDGSVRPVVANLMPGAGVDFIQGAWISWRSLNRNGEFLFRAAYRDPESRNFFTGLFRGSAFGIQELLLGGHQALPGMPPNSYTFDGFAFGLNDDGVCYYRVRTATSAVLFRHDAAGRTPLLAIGDAVAGSTVRAFTGSVDGGPDQGALFAGSGEVIVVVALTNNRGALLRYSSRLGEAPETLPLSWGAAAILDHHPSEGTLVYAALNNRLQLAIWKGGAAPEILLDPANARFEGQQIESILSGAYGPLGEIYFTARTTSGGLIGGQLRPAPRVLFQSGDPLNFGVEPVLLGFAGAKRGPVQLLTGGSGGAASVAEMQEGEFVPKLTVGDVIGRNSIFTGAQPWSYSRTASGQIFTLIPWVGGARDFGIGRLRTDGSAELLHSFNLRIDGLEYYMPSRLYVNDREDLLWQAFTSAGDQRLMLTRRGEHQVLLRAGPDGSRIDGLTVTDIFESAIDEQGRVMTLLRFRERPGLSFAGWDGERWTRLLTVGETLIDGRRVSGVGRARGAGDHLMALIYQDGGFASVIAFRNGRAETVVSPRDLTPLGFNVNWMNHFDVNSHGDVAFVSGYITEGQTVFVKRGDQTYVVLNAARPLDQGDLLVNFRDIEIRDDGTVYLLAGSHRSETLLLEARPRF